MFSRPVRAGQRYAIRFTSRSTSRAALRFADGKMLRGGGWWKLKYEADVTALKVDKKGQVKKESHKVKLCRISWRGKQEHDLFEKGTEITVDVYRKTIRMKPSRGKLEKALLPVFSAASLVRPGGPSLDDLYGTGTSQSVGGVWKANVKKVAVWKTLGATGEPKTSDGTSKLVHVGKSDGVEYAEVETRANARQYPAKVMKKFKLKSSEATFWATCRLPVDPKLMWAEYDLTLKGKVVSSGMSRDAPAGSVKDLLGRKVRNVLKGMKLPRGMKKLNLPGQAGAFTRAEKNQPVTMTVRTEILIDLKFRKISGADGKDKNDVKK